MDNSEEQSSFSEQSYNSSPSDSSLDSFLNDSLENDSSENNQISSPLLPSPIIASNNQNNLSLYQDNVNLPYKNFSEDLELFYKVNPLIFHYDFESYKYYNIGKKVLAPKSLLCDLSKYDNLEYPIHIKINNNIFTILDFIDNIDCIYVPTENFYSLGFEENMTQVVTIVKEIPPKASFLKIKPNSEKFYSVPDIKKYLEVHFNKLYLIVSKDEVLKVPYYEELLEITITDCKPENTVSLNEIEELEIDFEPLVDVNKIDEESKKLDIKQSFNFNFKPKPKESKKEKSNSDSKEFVPFSGKGRRLCD